MDRYKIARGVRPPKVKKTKKEQELEKLKGKWEYIGPPSPPKLFDMETEEPVIENSAIFEAWKESMVKLGVRDSSRES